MDAPQLQPQWEGDQGQLFDPRNSLAWESVANPPNDYGNHGAGFPFFYHVPEHKVYVGPWNTFHGDMFNGSSNPDIWTYYMQDHGSPSFGWGGRLNHRGDYHFYDDFTTSKMPEHVREEIRNQLPQYIDQNWPSGDFDDEYDRKLEIDPHAVTLDGKPANDLKEKSEQEKWQDITDNDWEKNDSLWNDTIPPREATLYESFRKAIGSEIKVVQKPNQGVHKMRGENSTYLSRIPFRYLPATGQVFMGYPGYYHGDIHTANPHAGQGILRDGYVWTNKGTMDWYAPQPAEHEEKAVQQALSRHLNMDLGPQDDTDYGNDSFWEDME